MSNTVIPSTPPSIGEPSPSSSQAGLNDQYYMAHALRLAERGLWSTDPNPRTGCVIVRDGEIVGEGWHQVAGEPHAEIHALQMAKEKAKGATGYVTLEPCCHYGRTPPCTEALINAGIARIVVATTDPNPIVYRKGIGQLSKAGITVDTGILSQEAEQLNQGFFMRMRHNRPYVRCKLAMSLDGRTAMASGESKWITSNDARLDVQCLRARSSAIMTGAGTVLSDDPQLTVREDELPCQLPFDKWATLKQPLRAIIDTHLSMPKDARMLSLPGQTVIFTASKNEAIKSMLEKVGAHVIYLPGKDREVDLPAVCQHLAEEYEVNELFLETGATLSGSMLRAGLIDELVIYMAPMIMGNKARGLFNLPDLASLNQHIPLSIVDIRAIGRDWRITCSVNSEQ
ncbi:MAG: bifunctional diaminohydroxyphosphoribosylaminopyrimidine deaminase/5-amino-6-(5-phosphoribosylamino)uracil reductase RibD [Candidatus Parabeggiatoa sp. nov. 3]|nr:MAG: bifunctional diaminohydroxyphosphoribosylaminopyrimidine deaminase/5-amino-6-(5-phosphoribosylamino)uracil reductase RibD [Gammaproteobacteria bacterium]RKZ64934.1 MAG: bifunctional diaminohydroxyphosphoribosylaminopyrimidine deaminase/5-amino-6-(5-phosphoribosylamino)uracil reductase RibD [Gammaproteobacteria bacterium]RKZ74428.1 MAG: bifunctional diaminohydroxyphosphoribosylaminopyrimidine deaminase/5-amino-6-(5-phosphoribosylamino)uracil reductase RibD [Gammaproteobacteria bacterium]